MNDFSGDWRMAAAMGMPHPDANDSRWSARDYFRHRSAETGAAPVSEPAPAPAAAPVVRATTATTTPATTPAAVGLAPTDYGWQAKLRAFADRLGVHPMVVVGGGVAIVAGIGTAIYFATREEPKP